MTSVSMSTGYQCPTCGKTFTRKSGLQIHLPSHSKQANFACRKGCGKKFLRSNDRNRHERAQHGEKAIICEGCGERFGRKDALYSHLRSKAGSTCKAVSSLPGIRQSTSKTNTAHTDNAPRQFLDESENLMDTSDSAARSDPEYIKYLEAENKRIQEENRQLRMELDDDIMPGIQQSTSETNVHHSNHALHPFRDEYQNSEGELRPARRYWSFAYASLDEFWENAEVKAAREMFGKSLMRCNVCFQRFITETSFAMHLVEHIVNYHICPFRCPLCSKKFNFSSTLTSHLHNTSRGCSPTAQLLWNGKVKSLRWGCGKGLSEGESNHDHLDECNDCLNGLPTVEDALCAVAFDQLTDLWAYNPEIVPALDATLGCNEAEDHRDTFKDNPLRLMRLLHEQIKNDTAWEPVSGSQNSNSRIRMKEIRGEQWFASILEILEYAPNVEARAESESSESSEV